MKIIYLHQYFSLPSELPSQAGGTRSYEMARRMVAWGHEVHMVTSRRDAGTKPPNGWTESTESGIQVHWYPVTYSNATPFKKRIRAFLKFAFQSTRKAMSLEGDVVFATSTPLTIALPGVFTAWRRRIPMVFEVRDLWPELPIAVGALKGRIPIALARWLERFAYRNATRVVALSQGMKDGVVRIGYHGDHVHVIPNSADLDLFGIPAEAGYQFRCRFEWLQDRPLVVYTGTFGLMNVVDYLVQLASKVREIMPEIRFLACGDCAKFDEVQGLARQLDVLDRNFFMLHSMPKLEIKDVLSAADMATSLFINLPAMWANSANKFFDALASGTAVAINYQGWQADLLNETGAGIVISVDNIDQAAHDIVTKVRDKAWIKAAGKAARQLAEERFSRDELTKRLEQVLEGAIYQYQRGSRQL